MKPESRSSHWRRTAAEGAAIIISILLAFWIDAWWEDRQQTQSDIAHLQGVLKEFQFHKVLLAEAMESHRTTVDTGYELFALLEAEQSPEQRTRIVEAINLMLNFYRINAPFGSLQTAISSGAIARMTDVGLASEIASWPTTIDDLLEEQDNAGATIILEHYARLGQKISLHEVYALRFANPTGRGTAGVIDEVANIKAPESHLTVDYKDIYDDHEIRNGFLLIMMFGQAALGEATLADQKLEGLTERLEQCVKLGRC